MIIGIIFAMEEELNSFLTNLKIKNKYKQYDLDFYEVEYFNKTLILCLSGVGKVNAARTSQILIDNFNINYIFNIGVAGGLSSNLNILDIVVAESLVQHDFDITSFNHPKGYIPNIGVNIKSSDYLVSVAKNVSKKMNLKINVGVIASGDIFVTNMMMSNKINNKFNALACEMEGASIAQVAYLSNIPFLVIRSISDVVGKDNKITYENFLNKSSLIVSNYLKEIIKDLK